VNIEGICLFLIAEDLILSLIMILFELPISGNSNSLFSLYLLNFRIISFEESKEISLVLGQSKRELRFYVG